jgi:hypothetical protein
MLFCAFLSLFISIYPYLIFFSLSLSSGDYENLEKAFEVPGDNLRILYKELVEIVDTVFTIKGLEKDPLIRPEDYVIPDFLDPSKRMEGEESNELHSVMIKLGLLTNKYRVIPKSYFKDAVNKIKIFLNIF